MWNDELKNLNNSKKNLCKKLELMQNITELMKPLMDSTIVNPPASDEPDSNTTIEDAPAAEKPILRQEGPKVNMPQAPTY